MDGSFDYTELVEKAQLGDEASMSRLAELARESLRRYVFRVTLDESVTQDILQEVMLEMFKVLGKLKRADRFRTWLHGIAFNRIRRHYGQDWCRKKVPMSEEEYLNHPGESREGLANLVNQELKQRQDISHIEIRAGTTLNIIFPGKERSFTVLPCFREAVFKRLDSSVTLRPEFQCFI